MKKFLLLLMASFLLVLSACGSSEVETVEEKEVETVEKEKEEEITEEEFEEMKEELRERVEEIEEEEVSQEEWEDHKVKLLKHYEKISVVDLQVDLKEENFVFWVIVPDIFKTGTDEDKQYYVDENAHFIQSDLEAFFPDDAKIYVFFRYEDGDPMAKPLSTGRWRAM